MRGQADTERRSGAETIARTRPGPVFRILFLLLGASTLGQGVGPVSVRLNPATITIAFLYRGVTLTIEGTLPVQAQPVVVIRGSTAEEVFHTKSKVGPLWISSGKVHICQAPSAFLLFAPAEIDQLVTREHIEQYQLAVDALRHSMEFTQEGRELPGEVIRQQFVRLKVSQGFYRVHNTAFDFAPSDSGTKRFTLNVKWPRALPAGLYRVELYACQGGRVIGAAQAQLELARVGFVAWLGRLAQQQPSVYGVLAILLAVAGGLTIDLLATRIFGKTRGRAGH